MKITPIITIACVLLAYTACAQPELDELQTEIIGSWLAGETLMPQPPPDMLQDIKSITFETNGIVKWTIAINGEIAEKIGRYVINPGDNSPRHLPSIFVAPVSYSNPSVSSICLLLMTDITVDLDARFHADKIGKTLKGSIGLSQEVKKNVVFVRKK